MIARGEVNARLEAILRLRIRGPHGTDVEVHAVIDTGYTGTLTLPTAVAESLGLKRGVGGQAVLADGNSQRFDTYAVEVNWGGKWRGLEAYALGNEVLIGMRFLAGHGLRIDVVDRGTIEVAALSATGIAEQVAAVDPPKAAGH